MLTFLRKIRKSLIDTGNTRKYLLYAIGEILLVVIGILIALQINNWNEGRKYAENEAYTLNEILNNLREDADQMQFIVERRSDANEAIEQLLIALPNPSISINDLDDDVSAFLTFERYFPLNNAFEMMKSTGLKVSNRSLRTAISRYYDFEQKKIAKSILDIEDVFVRIMSTQNEIRSNILRAQGGAGVETDIKFKSYQDSSIRDALLEELIPFQNNNSATLEKAKQFLELNQTLIAQVEDEMEKPRFQKYLEEE